jgi:hypothetical protein
MCKCHECARRGFRGFGNPSTSHSLGSAKTVEILIRVSLTPLNSSLRIQPSYSYLAKGRQSSENAWRKARFSLDPNICQYHVYMTLGSYVTVAIYSERCELSLMGSISKLLSCMSA